MIVGKLRLVFILCFLNSCTGTKNIIQTEQQLDTILENTLKYKRLTGFAVSIFTKDQVIYKNAFGYSDWEKKTPYTTETVQGIASVSKTTIGIALMKCQELGLFSLDDPINQNLPFKISNPYFPQKEITIRQLAMHTSSIKYSEQITDVESYDNPDMSMADFIYAYFDKKGKWYDDGNFHNTPPGTLGDYTNIGSALAAYIVEYKSGMPFHDFVKKYVFKPLGLTASQLDYETNETTQYYKYLSQGDFEKMTKKRDGLYPSGNQIANVEELTKFCQAILNKGSFKSTKILEQSSVEEMLDVVKLSKSLDKDDIHRQGVFWSTMKSPLGIPHEMIGHNGGDYGVYTMMFFNPKTGIGYILLSNTGMTEENHVSFLTIYKNLWNYSRSKKHLK